MDRRSFLLAGSAAGTGVSLAALSSDGVSISRLQTTLEGSSKRELIARTVQPTVIEGELPFVMARFTDWSSSEPSERAMGARHDPYLREIIFHGLNDTNSALQGHSIEVLSLTRVSNDVLPSYVWLKSARGAKSSSALFTAHTAAFAGLELTHVSDVGRVSRGVFAFAAGGGNEVLDPGLYVIAGRSAATGQPPDLAAYAFSGEPRQPVRASTLRGLDFPYLSFEVYAASV